MDSYVWKSIIGVVDIFNSGLNYTDGRWLWKHSFSGIYTVKSGYILAFRWKMARETHEGEGSDWFSKEHIWNKLWKAKVTDGAKILLWRLMFNALPVFSNLARRGIMHKTECSLCGFKEENSKHVFMDCWWALCLWQSLGLVDEKYADFLSLKDWIWHTIENGNKETVQKLCMGALMVWQNRNSIVHGKKGWTVPFCSFKVRNHLIQYDTRRLIAFAEDDDEVSEWEVHCDGSWSWQDGRGGWAAVISRNKIVLECSVGYARGGMTGLQTEVNAIIMGLQLAKKFCCVSATIYSDCIQAIWVFQRGVGHQGMRVDNLTQGLILLKDKPRWILNHTPRESNCFADSLARKARQDEWLWERSDAIPILL